MNLRDWQNNFLKEINRDLMQTSKSMQIYKASIINAKLASLRITYRAVNRLIGDEAFDCIAQSYLNWNTESPIDIGLLGQAFSDYLKQHDIISILPYIADLAKLEWRRYNVFEAKENTKNSISIESYEYAIDDIWACCQENYNGEFNVRVSPINTCIMIFRHGKQVRMRRVLYELKK